MWHGGLEAVWLTRGLKDPLKKIAGRERGETRNVRQSHLAIAAVGEVIRVKLTMSSPISRQGVRLRSCAMRKSPP